MVTWVSLNFTETSQLVAYIMGVNSSGRETISDTGTYEPIKVT